MNQLFKKALQCVREWRLPYAYYKLRHFVIACFRRVFKALRVLIPCRWEYLFSQAGYRLFLKKTYVTKASELDLVFVLKKKTSAWILEGICGEIARHFPGCVRFHYVESPSPWPAAKAYFFGHYSFLPRCLRSYASLWGSKILVFYTHAKPMSAFQRRHHLYALNQCAKVICMNSQSVRALSDQGVHPDRLTALVGAADPLWFKAHQRNGGVVGLSTAYYARKSPDTILEIVKAMPHRQFILLGPHGEDSTIRHRKWQQYPRFKELVSLPNFRYVEVPYSEYPRYYEKVDVFVSASKLEGGPVPLVETMMCNAVPVVSRTGFAPDVIRHGENGFLFDVASPVAEICALIERAYELRADIRRTVEHLSWENYSRQVQRLLAQPKTD